MAELTSAPPLCIAKLDLAPGSVQISSTWIKRRMDQKAHGTKGTWSKRHMAKTGIPGSLDHTATPQTQHMG